METKTAYAICYAPASNLDSYLLMYVNSTSICILFIILVMVFYDVTLKEYVTIKNICLISSSTQLFQSAVQSKFNST